MRFPSGNSTTFEATSGLRQGCPFSPIGFIMLIDLLIRTAHRWEGVKVPGITQESLNSANGGHPLNTIFFADDGTMIAESEAALQRIVTKTVNWSRRFGLQLNPSKCVSVRFCNTREMEPLHIWIGEQEIPCQDSFKHLGCTINRKGQLKSVAEQRLAQGETMIDMLSPLCRKLSYARVDVRRTICRSMIDGTVGFSAELWAWGTDVDSARAVTGKMGHRILGLSKNSNRTVGLLEADLLDIGAASLVKRYNWTRRQRWALPSPTKALWQTSDPAEGTVMSRILVQVSAANWGHEECKILQGPRRQELLDLFTETDLRSRISTSDTTLRYLAEFWRTPGQVIDNTGTFSPVATRALQQLRTGSFWFTPRLQHVGIYPPWGCIACQSEQAETREHFLLDCPAWRAAREKHLHPLIQSMAESPREEQARRLLGGRGVLKLKWEVEGKQAIMLFLEAVIKERQGVLQAAQGSPPKQP